MIQDRGLGLPERVVAKIEKVLGIPPSELGDYDLVKLVEELCDTALMFDRENRGARRAGQSKPFDQTPGASGTQP